MKQKLNLYCPKHSFFEIRGKRYVKTEVLCCKDYGNWLTPAVIGLFHQLIYRIVSAGLVSRWVGAQLDSTSDDQTFPNYR